MANIRQGDHRHATVMKLFSSITSPVLSELVIVLLSISVARLHHEIALFRVLREMSEVRRFKLVFLLEPWDFSQGEVLRNLERALDLVSAKGLLDFLDSPPTIR